MTTRWDIPSEMWQGETVAVICAGPDVTHKLVDSARADRRIAVRRAFELVPDADLLVAIDGPTGSLDDSFWKDAESFEGIKVCGVECDVDAKFIGTHYERIVLGPAHIVEVRNNGLFAIRIAAFAGAAKILLVGFDPERYEGIHGVGWLAAGLEQITAELRARGIEVERVLIGDGTGESLPPLSDDSYPPGAARLK